MQGSVRTKLAALVATLLLAPALGAQEIALPDGARAPLAPAAPVVQAAPAIPSRDAASVAVRAPVATSEASAAALPAGAAGAFSRGETYMIVGGAALLAGLIIGDDAGTLIAVGGAVVGLYGLYLYLGTQ